MKSLVYLVGPPGVGKSTVMAALTEKCAKTLGQSRVLDHLATEGERIAPTSFASRRCALRGFSSAKKASKNKIMRIYWKNIHLCVFPEKTDNIII